MPKCTKTSFGAVFTEGSAFFPSSCYSQHDLLYVNIDLTFLQMKAFLPPDFNSCGRATAMPWSWPKEGESCDSALCRSIWLIWWSGLEMAAFSMNPFHLSWKCCAKASDAWYVHNKNTQREEKQTSKTKHPVRLTYEEPQGKGEVYFRWTEKNRKASGNCYLYFPSTNCMTSKKLIQYIDQPTSQQIFITKVNWGANNIVLQQRFYLRGKRSMFIL